MAPNGGREAQRARREGEDIVPVCFASIACEDDRWDFARLNKLQPVDLTPVIRDLLRTMVAV